jgi:hypothetical protein
MEGRYEIEFKVSRDAARQFLAALATDEAVRASLESGPEGAAAELQKLGIEIDAASLPATITLPPPKEIEHILYAGDSLVGETASPFGLLVLFVVFGAMPVTTRRSPAGDGAG